jgi:hypothetical protein
MPYHAYFRARMPPSRRQHEARRAPDVSGHPGHDRMITAMPALSCPHCGVYSRFAKVWDRQFSDDNPWLEPAACYACDHSDKPIAVLPSPLGGLGTYWPTSVRGQEGRP